MHSLDLMMSVAISVINFKAVSKVSILNDDKIQIHLISLR